MKKEMKPILIGTAVSMLLNLLSPFLYAFLILHGKAEEENALLFFAVTSVCSAAVGALICRRRGVGLLPLLAAVGFVPQFCMALIGCLSFPVGFSFGGARWLLPALSLATVFLICMVSAGGGGQRRGGRRTPKRRNKFSVLNKSEAERKKEKLKRGA